MSDHIISWLKNNNYNSVLFSSILEKHILSNEFREVLLDEMSKYYNQISSIPVTTLLASEMIDYVEKNFDNIKPVTLLLSGNNSHCLNNKFVDSFSCIIPRLKEYLQNTTQANYMLTPDQIIRKCTSGHLVKKFTELYEIGSQITNVDFIISRDSKLLINLKSKYGVIKTVKDPNHLTGVLEYLPYHLITENSLKFNYESYDIEINVTNVKNNGIVQDFTIDLATKTATKLGSDKFYSCYDELCEPFIEITDNVKLELYKATVEFYKSNSSDFGLSKLFRNIIIDNMVKKFSKGLNDDIKKIVYEMYNCAHCIMTDYHHQTEDDRPSYCDFINLCEKIQDATLLNNVITTFHKPIIYAINKVLNKVPKDQSCYKNHVKFLNRINERISKCIPSNDIDIFIEEKIVCPDKKKLVKQLYIYSENLAKKISENYDPSEHWSLYKALRDNIYEIKVERDKMLNIMKKPIIDAVTKKMDETVSNGDLKTYNSLFALYDTFLKN